jgi:biotin-dependent carboxylase-like uncharacterized protein
MGRPGFAFYAIPASGVMDKSSAAQANLIIGNPPLHPVIECTMIPAILQFNDPCYISITGAQSNWTINNIPVEMNQAIQVRKDDILKGTPFNNGLRAYIAISGKIESPQYLHSQSYSTYLPHEMSQIATLKNGDTVEWSSHNYSMHNLDVSFRKITEESQIKVRPGPEFHTLDTSSQVLLQAGITCTIGDQSNRMGSLLNGPILNSEPAFLDKSVAIIPGMIQLTSSGQMIVVLQDGQTTGGYPRIVYMTRDSLDVYNQIPIRRKVKLVLTL